MDGAVADGTGHPEVVVTNNALTQVTFPDVPPFGPPPQTLPLGFDPQVVRVSPGTTVTWHWATYADPFPDFFNEIPHNTRTSVCPTAARSSITPPPASRSRR